jgi:hypothetical protein
MSPTSNISSAHRKADATPFFRPNADRPAGAGLPCRTPGIIVGAHIGSSSGSPIYFNSND